MKRENEMKNEIELVFIPDDKYIHNMQSQRGKANIFYKDEPENKYDSEAIAVYTLNREKEEVFLGYIKKNDVDIVYTQEAQKLYEYAQSGGWSEGVDDPFSWETAKANENWGKVEEVIKTPIYTKEELEQIKRDIEDGKYRFRYDFDMSYGYLFKK